MKIENIILIGLIVIVVGVLIYSIVGMKGSSSNEMTAQAQKTNLEDNTLQSFKSVDSGSTSPGDVSIELTPHKPENGELKVDIAVNTHSVDLSAFNLKEITTLKMGSETIKPINAPELGGHHSSGTLVFPITDYSETFSISIEGIPKVQERIFAW